MTREEALSGLEDHNSHRRLLAARALYDVAQPADRETLVTALRQESVRWVRTALETALSRLGGAPDAQVVTAAEARKDKDEIAEAYLRGEKDAVRQFLHEIGPLVGLVALYARQEMPTYPESRTQVQVERLRGLVSAFEELSKAFANQATETFDLANCLHNVCHAAMTQHEWEVAAVGPAPFLITSKPHLVDLVVSNALRNAIEAEKQLGRQPSVLVSWGDTDKDYYISVLDGGLGLPPGLSKAFEKGTSTKVSHSGMGLAIAHRASASLGGRLSLRPREGGGTAFELRWPREPLGDESFTY